MRAVTPEVFAALQKNPKNIRHICILAHVDHGKTTLADSLLASNGIISHKMAGKLRYMDSRKDEQERGITMKSSAVAVYYKKDEEDYLINVIDSPGHVDFAGEVCTAVRLCDGAIIIVDVIEGVCSQTKVALKQAWLEHIKPLLVFNKLDRLISEWKLTPLDAYAHLVQILEQVNAVVGELFASDILKKSENKNEEKKESKDSNELEVFDWSSGLDDSDDSTVYFSPEQGNVVFASALDGWGFGISQFAKIFSKKLGAREELLKKTLWGDFYLNSKTKQIFKGAQVKAKKPLFVQFILESIWSVYDAVLIQKDKGVVEKMIKSLNLTIPPREVNHKDAKVCLQAIFGQWLPLSNAVLEMVCNFVPSPLELSEEKVEGLMCSSTLKFDVLPQQTQKLKSDFLQCGLTENAPVIVCISKMFPVDKKMLPENRQKPLTAEEIAERREKARQRHRELAQATEKLPENEAKTPELTTENEELCESTAESDTAFIAFARVYSGSVRKGQKLYVLGPKHDPAKALTMNAPTSEEITVHDLHPEQHVTLATIKNLYLLMGKELVDLEESQAGNVIGIGGLQDHVLKSATLSSTIACPSFIDLHSSTVPIVRVALEPSHPRDMPALVRGMRLLNQADPCVQVFVQETGEHVLVSAGEVHLQRCVDDLKERFAKIDLNVSAPIVPFRETVILPPKVDMVNEVIEEKVQSKKVVIEGEEQENPENSTLIKLKTPNKLSCIHIVAKPLPSEVTKLLEENSALLKLQDQVLSSQHGVDSNDCLTPETIKALEGLKEKLNKLFTEAGSDWNGAVDQIWAFGPRRCGPNILLNRIAEYKRLSVWEPKHFKSDTPHFSYDSTFISGFQLATLCGPLCDEPMMGVCFIVEDWTFEQEAVASVSEESESKSEVVSKLADLDLNCDTSSICSSGPSSASSTPFGPFTGQIMSTVKEACKKAFQAQPQRLMCAMYSCYIQVTTDMLGKMYAVLGRRHGRILHADMQEGSQTFHVTAELPVVESFDFTNEIRKQTSGMALPQLVFSHWEVVDVDPFWVPRTEEEYAHFGEKADVENRARKYMNSVRRRKGLSVDEKVVEHAEKQRTLQRKK